MGPMKAGALVWLPCEVKPGPFSNERLVRIVFPTETWIGFVETRELQEPIETGKTRVRARVLDEDETLVLVAVPGHALNTSLVKMSAEEVSRFVSLAA